METDRDKSDIDFSSWDADDIIALFSRAQAAGICSVREAIEYARRDRAVPLRKKPDFTKNWQEHLSTAVDAMSGAFVSGGWAIGVKEGAVTLGCQFCDAVFPLTAQTKDAVIAHRKGHLRQRRRA